MQDRLRNLHETVGEKAEVEYIRKIVGENAWTFAKSYAAFCPHEYTMRKAWKNREDYKTLVRHIWKYGLDAYYGRATEPKRYWFDHETGLYYFIYPEDTDEEGNVTEEAFLLNRAKISDFVFWEDADLLGSRIRCRYKSRAEREGEST